MEFKKKLKLKSEILKEPLKEKSRVIVLNKLATEVMINILEDRRREIWNTNFSDLIEKNKVFLSFLRHSLSKKDPKAEKIDYLTYALITQYYFQCENPDYLAGQKIIAYSQLEKIRMDFNFPVEVLKNLEDLLKNHIEVNSSLLVDSKLLSFISNKIPDIFEYFSKDILEDYVTLMFFINSNENFEKNSLVSFEEMIANISSEDQKSKEIVFSLKKQVFSDSLTIEKLKIIKISYCDIVKSIKSLSKKLKIKGNRVLELVSCEILEIFEEIMKESSKILNFEKLDSIIEEKKILAEVNNLIFFEQNRIADEYSLKIKNFQKIESELESKNETQVLQEKTEALQKIKNFFDFESKTQQVSEFLNEVSEFHSKRQKNNKELQNFNQELSKLHEIYEKKSQKIESRYEIKNGVLGLLNNKWTEWEKNIFLRERKNLQQKKILDIKKEKFRLYKENYWDSALTEENDSCINKFLFYIAFVIIGILINLLFFG